MITATGYSQQPGIMPEGIAVTFGAKMIEEQGGLKTFLAAFQSTMQGYENGEYWMHTMSNFPKIEIDRIYIVAANRLYGMAYCGGFNRNQKALPILQYPAIHSIYY